MKKTKPPHSKKANPSATKTKPKAAIKRLTAVFPGRFQPFHNGHYHVLKRLISRYRVIVAIGSADKKDKDNPFSSRQRKEMIQSCFPRQIASGQLKFAFIPDAPDRTWAQALLKAIPRRKFDLVFTNNPRVQKQLRKTGILCIGSPLVRRPQWEGARIRRWQKGWEKAVPKAVAKIIFGKLNRG